ncbi:MAG: 50S ribosomal protein L20 [Candidatus Gracilibacteria bacterium]|nr:50S ribosomal protein L20 [Candidatus Gracilibacteria bacterium]
MSRVKRGVQTHKRHKKVIKQAKGFRAGRSRVFKWAKQAVMKSGINSYRDRRRKKRTFRQLWTVRISAAVKPLGLNYSRFINMLFKKNVVINRKMLSEIAFQHPEAFEALVKDVQ